MTIRNWDGAIRATPRTPRSCDGPRGSVSMRPLGLAGQRSLQARRALVSLASTIAEWPVKNRCVLKPLVIMVGVGSVALNSQLKLYDALLLLLAASLLSALTNFICWKKMGSKYRHGSVAVSSGWMSTGLGFLGITLCNTALNQIDILMIGSMLGAEQGDVPRVAPIQVPHIKRCRGCGRVFCFFSLFCSSSASYCLTHGTQHIIST